MLFLKLLNLKVVIALIMLAGAIAGGFFLRVVAITDAVHRDTVRQVQRDRQNMHEYKAWRLK
jgi:hypothetical protein